MYRKVKKKYQNKELSHFLAGKLFIFQIFLSNSLPQRGQRTVCIPFLFFTRSCALHMGHFRYLKSFLSLNLFHVSLNQLLTELYIGRNFLFSALLFVMFRESERNNISARSASWNKSITRLAVVLKTKIFTIQSTKNKTHRKLLSVSVPYLPCINIASLFISCRIWIILSLRQQRTANMKYKGTVLSQFILSYDFYASNTQIIFFINNRQIKFLRSSSFQAEYVHTLICRLK